MNALPVSVVIVSRGRPDSLKLCLAGVARLFHRNYEVIVVADSAGLAAVASLPFAEQIKTVRFDVPNIAEARNLGIAEVAGDVVAFIDDDAVPEPTWLTYLTAPFAVSDAAAAGGYVRGRNGVSFQWRANTVLPTGETQPLNIEGPGARVLTPCGGRAVKTEGTNMAFRRESLAESGGFDPGFRYFLDETDLNMRLATSGEKTAIVPMAQVHHAYAGNSLRGTDRRIRDLRTIGMSQALFLKKHCPANIQAEAAAAFETAQRKRVLRQLVDGLQEPTDVPRLLQGLRDGLSRGRDLPIANLPAIPRSSEGFRPFASLANGQVKVLSGRIWNLNRLREEAAERAAAGETVTVYALSHSTVFHHVRFRRDGYWEQIGGMWGRSDRSMPVFSASSFHGRVEREVKRVADVRQFPTEDA